MADSLLSRQGLGDGGADQVLEHCVETREERKRANNNVGYGVPRYYSVGRSGSSSGGDTRCKCKRLNIPLILSYFFFLGEDCALYTLIPGGSRLHFLSHCFRLGSHTGYSLLAVHLGYTPDKTGLHFRRIHMVVGKLPFETYYGILSPSSVLYVASSNASVCYHGYCFYIQCRQFRMLL